MNWRELERLAPEIVRLGAERLDQAGVALLGTLREDGSPRISPVEPCLSQDHLLIGTMSWSSITRALRRDPRFVLHSAISNPDSGEGELKLYGRVIVASEQIRQGCRQGWWVSRPPGAASVFSLDIGEATFISWDVEHGTMTARRWSPARGYRETARTYP